MLSKSLVLGLAWGLTACLKTLGGKQHSTLGTKSIPGVCGTQWTLWEQGKSARDRFLPTPSLELQSFNMKGCG